MRLDDAIGTVSGIGPKKEKLLKKIGISNVQDLLYYMPRTYESSGRRVKISGLKEEELCSVTAVITYEPKMRTRTQLLWLEDIILWML